MATQRPWTKESCKDECLLVAGELLSTEESYVDNLHIFIKVMAPVLREDKHTGNDPFILALISNAEQVYTLNKKFLTDLDAILLNHSQFDDTISIASLFLDYAPLFKIYAQYAKNHETGVNAIQGLRKTFPKIEKIVSDLEFDSKCKGQSLWSFLIMPIQRVPRYVMLCRELKKRLPASHPDKSKMDDTIAKLSEVGDFLNESIRKRENMDKIAKLETMFSDRVVLLVAGRVLLKEGPLKRLSHKGHLTEYYFHLFNDLILYSKINLQGYFVLKKKLELLNSSVESFDKYNAFQEPVDPGCAFKFTNPAASFVLVAKSPEESQEWIVLMSQLILNIGASKSQSDDFIHQFFSLVRGSVGSSKAEEYSASLESAAPIWVPDTEAVNCYICDAEFSFFNRKHHCRNCGRVVCHACSPYKRVLQNISDENSVRICRNCEEDLKSAYKRYGTPFFVLKEKNYAHRRNRRAPSVEDEDDHAEEDEKGTIIDPKSSIQKEQFFTQTSTINYGTSNSLVLADALEALNPNHQRRPSKKKSSIVDVRDINWNQNADHPVESRARAPPEANTAQEDPRLEIVIKILAVEKEYVESLEQLLRFYIIPLMNSNSALKKKSSGATAITVCFDCIEQILTVHTKFLSDLQDRIQKWAENPYIGDIFIAIASFFRIYGSYAAHFESAITQLKSPSFNDSIKELRHVSPNLKRMEDLLNLPMQRIIFNARDWKHLTRVTPADHRDSGDLEMAMKSLMEAAEHIQEAVDSKSNRARILEIEEMFIGRIELINPSRKFIREGLMLVSDRQGNFYKRHVHLLSDILLCSENTNLGYSLKRVYPISHLVKVEILENDSLGVPFPFAVRGVESSFMASVSNGTLRDAWIKDITAAIAKDAAKRSNRSESVRLPKPIAPLWVPDNSSDSCKICNIAFSFWNRRHHCRKCGLLVCHQCSLHRVTLATLDHPFSGSVGRPSDPVRVCSNCIHDDPIIRDHSMLTRSKDDLAGLKKPIMMEDEDQKKNHSQLISESFKTAFLESESLEKVGIPGIMQRSKHREDMVRPSDAFLTRSFEDGQVEKCVTEDGRVYYYDRKRDRSVWNLNELVTAESSPAMRHSRDQKSEVEDSDSDS